jgi:hypothetical protein
MPHPNDGRGPVLICHFVVNGMTASAWTTIRIIEGILENCGSCCRLTVPDLGTFCLANSAVSRRVFQWDYVEFNRRVMKASARTLTPAIVGSHLLNNVTTVCCIRTKTR